MKFTKTNDINGTHLQGNVGATYQELIQVFGEPKRYESDGTTNLDNKVDVEWSIKFEDGTVATIYNYKNGINYMGAKGLRVTEMELFNIGGYDERAVILVNDEVIEWQYRLHQTGKSTNNLVEVE